MTESPDNSAIEKLFPYRLKLSKRGRGRPIDYFKKQVDDAQIVRAVARARAKHGQLEAAIEEVKSRSKLSRTRIFKALASKNKIKITKSQ
jgi:hypothetical protein